MRYLGKARDLFTPAAGQAPVVLAEEGFEALLSPGRIFESIVAEPPREGLARLVGKSGAAGFRRALAEALPSMEEREAPLYLALDDIPGANIVSGVAWAEFDPDWTKRTFGDLPMEVLLKARQDVCIGHAAGSSAQDPARTDIDETRPEAASLLRIDDPDGWHAMERQDGVGFRRMRRIDVSLADTIIIDAEFQDSAARPGGGRVAVHEYGLRVTASPETLEVLSIAATPRVLPYAECPGVRANLDRLLGVPLPDLRKAVPVALAGALGCTHLNDTIRQLADMPVLLRHFT